MALVGHESLALRIMARLPQRDEKYYAEKIGWEELTVHLQIWILTGGIIIKQAFAL